MNALERLLEWAPFATPRERWRMERDLDGVGVPFAVDEEGHRQRAVVSLDLPTGEDVEYLWALIQAGPDLIKAASALERLACQEGGPEWCWEQADWPESEWCSSCRVLAPLLREDGR